MEEIKLAEYFAIESIIALYALGYITICSGGDIEVIKKEQNND